MSAVCALAFIISYIFFLGGMIPLLGGTAVDVPSA